MRHHALPSMRSPATTRPMPARRPIRSPLDEAPGGELRSVRARRPDVFPYLAVCPLVVIMAVFTFFPVGYAAWASLHQMLLSRPQSTPFIGLQNYVEVVLRQNLIRFG
jgi:hypothetical protein